MSLSASSAKRKAVSSTAKPDVIRGLVAGLLAGEWQDGDRITEAQVSDRFGVSRTPVREALLEMRGLGLLELRRNCGAVFHAFGPDELRELYAVRCLLEVEATRLASGRIERDLLDDFVHRFRHIRESGEADPGWQHDRAFHAAIADASGNRRLASEIARYGEIIQQVREIVGTGRLAIHSTTADEHLAIAAALQEGDSEKSGRAMRAHLTQASSSAAEVVARMRAESVRNGP